MIRERHRPLSAFVAVFALGLAACGGDDSGGDADVTTTTVDGETDTTAGGEGSSAWCALAVELDGQDDPLSDADPFDPDAIEVAFAEFREVIGRTQSAAPEEIRADVDTLADGLAQLDAALADVDYNMMDFDLSTMLELEGDLDAASTRIAEFNERECGIERDPLDTGGSGIEPGSGTPREMLVDQFVASGFTPAEAECIADNLDISSVDGADQAAVMEVFETCGLDLSRLAEIGGG